MSDRLITAIHHASLIVADTKRALAFYCGVLGLEQDHSRPDLGYPGAWLQVGDGQIHLLELPNPDPIEGRPAHGGRDRHLAMTVTDLARIENALEQTGVSFSLSKSGRHALFCRDVDGNAIELIEITV
ncbi:MAG: VOC family protein [Gammaproteobacteria bacterium]